MVATTLGKAVHFVLSSHQSRLWCPVLQKAATVSSFIQPTQRRMTSSSCFAELETNCEKSDQIFASLLPKIAIIKKHAVRQAGLEEEERLIQENQLLRREIESVRRALVVAEIEHGVRQVSVPTKGAIRALASQKTAATSTTQSAEKTAPLVNGTTHEPSSQAQPKEGRDKKTKQADQEPAGGKKAKIDKKSKEEKGEGESKPKKVAAASGDKESDKIDVSKLDFRVGKIVSVERHPDADTLYVEQVDLGEGRNRTVVSGLVKHFPLSAMKDRIAVFMCNLKPNKIRGVLSEAMIMCAVGPEKTEILVPPTDSVIGDRVVVQEFPGQPDEQLNPKKKIWETLKPDIRTNSERVASYKGASWTIPGKGVVVAPTLADTQIS